MADLDKELSEKSKVLDLDNFFVKDHGNIHIFLSDYRIKNFFSEEAQTYLYTFLNNNWWIFESKSGSQTLTSDYRFTLDNKEVKFGPFQKVILETKKRWDKKYPHLLFPDIVINSGGSALHFSEDKKMGNLMYINHQTFNDINSFKSHLGHELGHIIYKETISDNQIFFNHNNLVFKYLIMLLVISNVIFFIEDEGKLIFLLNQAFIFLLAGSYYYLNLRSFKSRIKRYNCEYFCDFFSYKFMKINPKRASELYDIGEDLHSHTHPRSSFRKKRIDQHKNKVNFKNLTTQEMKYHQFLPINNLLTNEQHIAFHKLSMAVIYAIMISFTFLVFNVAAAVFFKLITSFLGIN